MGCCFSAFSPRKSETVQIRSSICVCRRSGIHIDSKFCPRNFDGLEHPDLMSIARVPFLALSFLSLFDYSSLCIPPNCSVKDTFHLSRIEESCGGGRLTIRVLLALYRRFPKSACFTAHYTLFQSRFPNGAGRHRLLSLSFPYRRPGQSVSNSCPAFPP